MKRLGCLLLAVIFSLTLVITPVAAKGAPAGKGNSGNKGSATVQKSSNADKGNNKADSINRGQSKKNSTDSINRGQSKKTSNKQTTVVIDGKKEVSQKRIKSREIKTVKKEFKDTKGHWAQNSIQKVQQLGLIQGYEDGSFNPDAVVSQVEALVMVVNLAELVNDESITDETNEANVTEEENTDTEQIEETGTDDETTDENSEDDSNVSDEEDNDTDVPAWARNQARKASLAKIININRFHSEVQASRAQVAVMLAKALELEPVEVDENAFTDTMKISPEDIGYILALNDAGVINGTPDEKFNPNSAVTRAEIATMLANAMEAIEDEEEGDGDQSEEESASDSIGDDTDTGTTDEASTDTENQVVDATPTDK